MVLVGAAEEGRKGEGRAGVLLVGVGGGAPGRGGGAVCGRKRVEEAENAVSGAAGHAEPRSSTRYI